MNSLIGRSLIVFFVAVVGAAGWFISEERVARLERENARLLQLVNEDRLIGTTRSRESELEPEVAGATAPRAPVAAAPDEGALQAAQQKIKALEGELAELSLPLAVSDVASTVVNAAVRPGETLVTGGYFDGGGNYVFTMATPENVLLDNGDAGIRFEFREFAVPAESVHDLGLGSIVSGARNTLQHGETWNAEEAEAVIDEISRIAGSDLLTSPMITTRPGQQASVQVGTENQTRTISVNAEMLPDEPGYALRMRVEHRGIEDAAEAGTP